jgi:ribosomal protein L7/L12
MALLSSRFLSYRSFSSSALRPSSFRLSSFDVAAKLKDAPNSTSAEISDKKRKPSDRVLRLVDDILNLSLVEAADLCDLCSERLGTSKSSSFFPMMPGNFYPPPGVSPASPATPPPPAAPAPPASAAAAATAATPAAAAPAAAGKSMVSIKLVSFDAGKKVQTVKEVRAMTALGLKEAKEAVEGAPKILKKGVPIEEAQMWKKKLMEECGAVVELE